MSLLYVTVQIRGALARLEGLQQPVDVRIIRDHVTSASRGFCFLEFATGEVSEGPVCIRRTLMLCTNKSICY